MKISMTNRLLVWSIAAALGIVSGCSWVKTVDFEAYKAEVAGNFTGEREATGTDVRKAKDEVTATTDALAQKVTANTEKLTGLDEKVDALDLAWAAVQKKFEDIEKKFTTISDQFKVTKAAADKATADVKRLEGDIKNVLDPQIKGATKLANANKGELLDIKNKLLPDLAKAIQANKDDLDVERKRIDAVETAQGKMKKLVDAHETTIKKLDTALKQEIKDREALKAAFDKYVKLTTGRLAVLEKDNAENKGSIAAQGKQLDKHEDRLNGAKKRTDNMLSDLYKNVDQLRLAIARAMQAGQTPATTQPVTKPGKPNTGDDDAGTPTGRTGSSD